MYEQAEKDKDGLRKVNMQLAQDNGKLAQERDNLRAEVDTLKKVSCIYVQNAN